LSVFHVLAHFTYMKVCFTGMLNWKYSRWLDNSAIEVTSNLTSTFGLFLMLLYPVYETGHAILYY